MSRIVYGLLAGFFGIASYLNFSIYNATPELKNIGLVKNEVAYVQEYSGPSPSQAMDHVLESVGQVELSNPGHEKDILALEDELRYYQSGLEGIGSEVIYAPVLDAVAGKLDTFADDHTKNGQTLAFGIGYLTLCGIFAGLTAVEPERRQQK
jgi:hypothetical protein